MSDLPTLPPCPVCGDPIPERPRGSRHGHPPKTCSEACRKIRAAERERARYQRVKNTEEWKSARAGYLESLAARMAGDAELRARVMQQRRDATARHAEGINADPIRRASRLQYKRDYWRNAATPQARARWRAQYRNWYRRLTPDERRKIFYEPRAWRGYERTMLARLEIVVQERDAAWAMRFAKSRANYKNWSGEEIQMLRSMWRTHDARTLSARLSRTVAAVRNMASALGLIAESGRDRGGSWHQDGRRARRWSEFERRFIRAYYPQFTLPQIAQAMGLSYPQVKGFERRNRRDGGSDAAG